MSHSVEILAPVGNWEMCKAAVHNGADAIYVGMPRFNARGRTELFTPDMLGEMISFCHLYGTRVFVAANILIFERELNAIQDLLYQVIPFSPDAFIVQDIGLVRLIRAIAPRQVIHASTQMTVSSYEAIEMTADLCMQRYVLARENSISEIQKIRAKTDKELEVFVHGALCVAYSGQCLTSEAFGGRSANRGQCAQACRLPYELVVDGSTSQIPEKRYLVSPQDLYGLDDVPRLMEAGVDSFKIEGRLKSPHYVAEAVRHYKAKVQNPDTNSPKARESLGRIYSRGFYNGWLDGVNHQQLVTATYSNHHGIALGIIQKIERGVVYITPKEGAHEVSPGDGMIFEDFSAGRNFGASVYAVSNSTQGTVGLSFSNDFDLRQLCAGMTAFINATPKLMKEIERTWSIRGEMRKIPLSVSVAGKAGEPLTLTATDDLGHACQLQSNAHLETAQKAPISSESLRQELGALGTTPFKMNFFQNTIHGPVFIHNREIKELRKLMVEKIAALRTCRSPVAVVSKEDIAIWRGQASRSFAPQAIGGALTQKLNVLVRDPSQIDGLAGLPLDTVYLDYEFGKDYAPSVVKVRDLGFKAGVATTRILKPGETGHLKVIQRLKPDVILARNPGALYFLSNAGIELRADFSFNVTNGLTASWLLEKGVSSFCPSYDLNSEQLKDLLKVIDGRYIEVTIHQYMPAFHMEHCVFAAFLSTGSSYRDCGKPCEKHRVDLRDQKGALHPLKADAECRNTMFHGNAQSAARLLGDLKEHNVAQLRIEALYETALELRQKVECYLALMDGAPVSQETFRILAASERYGVTEGQLFNINTYQDRKKASDR